MIKYRKDLRLINKQLLDDIKIYSSSERRVIATADVFAKALLDIQDIPESLVVVNKEMLDDSNLAKEQMDTVKSRLQAILNPHESIKIPDAYLPENIEDPEALVAELVELLAGLRKNLRFNFEALDIGAIQERWCCAESPLLFRVSKPQNSKQKCIISKLKSQHGYLLVINRNAGKSCLENFVMLIETISSLRKYRSCMIR
jgi:inositol-hexakisphosphate/diphosphoinositol-pentakisphosphate 1-kinase